MYATTSKPNPAAAVVMPPDASTATAQEFLAFTLTPEQVKPAPEMGLIEEMTF